MIRMVLLVLSLIFSIAPFSGKAEAKETRLKVVHVRIDGNNVYSDRRLHRIMITRPSIFLSKTRYRPEILDEDIKALEQFYHQNGYLEAAVVSHEAVVDSSRSTVDILIEVEEGSLTTVEGVSILGNTAFSDSILMKYVKVKIDKPFQSLHVDAATMALLTVYANNGYLDAEVNPDISVDSENHRALVDFTINEKYQSVIGGIKIQGLDKTRKSVVSREFQFKDGDVINYSRLLETQRNIYLTGLFQSVFIRPHVLAGSDSTVREIIVDMKENMSGEFNIAGGYGAVDKARGKVELYNNNLRGTALKLGLVGRISYVQRGVETSFTNPWTIGTPWRTDVNIYKEWKSEPSYEFDRYGGRLTVGRRIRSNTYTVTYRNEHVKLKNVETSEIPDKLKSDTRSLKTTLIRDTRDNLFNASKGAYLETSGEFGAFFTPVSYGFFRLTAQAKQFFPIGNKAVAATSLDLGFINARGGYDIIPLHERYYIGGPNSLRGFAYEKAGPLDEKDVPVGGTCKIVWNILEVRRDIYKMFGVAAFAEAGNVWTQITDISLKGVRWDVGYGLRMNTPIGLARLDFGYNLDRKEGEKGRYIYFNMGQAF